MGRGVEKSKGPKPPNQLGPHSKIFSRKAIFGPLFGQVDHAVECRAFLLGQSGRRRPRRRPLGVHQLQ